MRDRTKFCKAKKTACAFDRVYGAVDAIQTLQVPGMLLQRHKILIKLIKIFLGFLEEFAYELFVFQLTIPSANQSLGTTCTCAQR